MPNIELATVYRCKACNRAVEDRAVITVPTLPGTLPDVDIPMMLPDGYMVGADGQLYCAAHAPRRVMPVTIMPEFPARNGKAH